MFYPCTHFIHTTLHYINNKYIYSYPKTVYISNDLHELGWNIKCLSMSNNDDSSCSNVKAYPFWIEQKWQEIIGWFMVGLVLLMSCIGHFIAYLKKRARKKHRAILRKDQKGGSIPVGSIGQQYDHDDDDDDDNQSNRSQYSNNNRNNNGNGNGKIRNRKYNNRKQQQRRGGGGGYGGNDIIEEELKHDSDQTPIPDDY